MWVSMSFKYYKLFRKQDRDKSGNCITWVFWYYSIMDIHIQILNSAQHVFFLKKEHFSWPQYLKFSLQTSSVNEHPIMGIKKAKTLLWLIWLYFFLLKLWKEAKLRAVCFLHSVNIFLIQGEQILFISYHKENSFSPQDGSYREKHQALRT